MLIPGVLSAPDAAAPGGAEVGANGSESKPVALRFEDVTEDGRFRLETLPNALGPTIWGGTLARDPLARACYDRGIIAILVRFALEGTSGPFSATGSLDAEASYRIAFSEDDRLTLDVWASLHAPLGRTYGPPPASNGERAVVGRVYAEHVFTRPFAPAGKRRVRRADFDNATVQRVQGGRPPASDPSGALVLGPGVTVVEPDFRLDAAPVTFGILHTDSNRHVNSISYVRLFEELALRRSAELGRGSAVLAREMDVRYRKPCLSGQTMRVAQQAIAHGDRLGMRAMLLKDEDAAGPPAEWAAKANTLAQTWFDR